jgi:hypothetical protein
MLHIDEYLRSHCKEIIDSVEGSYIPIETTTGQIFNYVATEVQKTFVIDKDSRTGVRDQAHNVLTMAIICSMWCGWLSQAKATDGRYPQEWVDSFKNAVIDAFEIGQEYSAVRY